MLATKTVGIATEPDLQHSTHCVLAYVMSTPGASKIADVCCSTAAASTKQHRMPSGFIYTDATFTQQHSMHSYTAI